MTDQLRRQPSLLSRSFYVALGLWMVALVVVGFWPTYYGPLLWGTFDLKPIVEIHAVYIIGLILHLVSLVRLPLQDSEAWFSFSKWVYGLFT